MLFLVGLIVGLIIGLAIGETRIESAKEEITLKALMLIDRRQKTMDDIERRRDR
jgi:hypothetical protein